MTAQSHDRIALDTHTHLVPVAAGKLTAFDEVDWIKEGEKLSVDGHVVGMSPLFHPERLLSWLDEQRIGQAWVSIPPPLYRPHLTVEEADGWTRALNLGLAEICARHGDRLRPLAHLPVEHPALAAAIAGEAMASGTFAGAAMSTGQPGDVLSDPRYDPLWTALDRHSAFLMLHPGDSHDPRLDPYYLTNLLGNPFETTLAAAHLVFAGIPRRFPAMRLCLAHAGGAAALLAGRWDRGQETARPGIDTAAERPSDTLRRMFADCVAHDTATLEFASARFGADHILFGSDWPFPMGLIEPHRQLGAVSEATRARIFRRGAP